MHEYRITGTRFLRRYTAPAMTPSTAAGSDAAAIAARLCDVAWKRSDERYPTFPVYGKPDENVDARESFDAAEWCAGHDEAKRHRVYANACIYRYEIPEGVRGRSCAKVRVKVTCDPYTPQGARVSVATTSSDDLPTSCQDCRAGDVHAEGVSPRTAVVENGSTYWYETTTTAELDYGRELGKYLVVFIGLEDYRARNGWLEGAARIDAVSLVFDDVVDGFTEDGENDLGDGVSADREFPVCSGGVLPYAADGDRFVRSYECLAAGGDLPPAKTFSPQKTEEMGLWISKAKQFAISTDARGIKIFVSPIASHKNKSGTTTTTTYYQRLVAILGVDFENSTHQWLPRVALYLQSWGINTPSDSATPTTTVVSFKDLTYSDVGLSSSSSGKDVVDVLTGYFEGPAYKALASGRAKSLTIIPSTYVSDSYGSTRVLFSIYVSTEDETCLVGVIFQDTSDLRKFIPYTGGSAGTGVGGADYIMTTIASAVALSATPWKASNGTLSYSVSITSAWWNSLIGVRFSNSEDGTFVVSVDGHEDLHGVGKVYGISPNGPSWSNSFIVYGDFRSIGGRVCDTVAIVSIREYRPSVWVPPVDGRIRPDSFVHYQVGTVWFSKSGEEKFIVTGTFRSLSGKDFSGYAVADCRDGSVSSGGYVDSIGAKSNGCVLAAVGLNSSIPCYVTGNYVREFSARSEADIPTAQPTADEACVGLGNVYAKLVSGSYEEVPAGSAAQPGASFVVRRGSVSVPSTPDGVTEGATETDMWRISATAALVPFARPSSYAPRKVRVSWSGLDCTPGAILNVWLCRGRYVDRYPKETLGDHRIHDASVSAVGDWELVASLPADESGDAAVDIEPLTDSVGTFLLTAYMRQEDVLSATDQTVALGVGTVSSDSFNGTVTDLDTGWRPDISLIG